MDVDCWILIVVTEKARVRKNNNFVRGCSVLGSVAFTRIIKGRAVPPLVKVPRPQGKHNNSEHPQKWYGATTNLALIQADLHPNIEIIFKIHHATKSSTDASQQGISACWNSRR